MILVLKKGITEEQKNHIRSILRREGYLIREMSENGRPLIGAIGKGDQSLDFFEGLPGVARVTPISSSFKLASRKMHHEDTLVDVGDVVIGGERIVVIAGPCAKQGTGPCHRQRGQKIRCGPVSRGGLQTEDITLFLPGPWGGRPENPG